jgi:hypothetical protein
LWRSDEGGERERERERVRTRRRKSKEGKWEKR